MKRLAKFWSRYFCPFGPQAILRSIHGGFTFGATFFRPLRGLLESLRFPKSRSWRALVMLSAAFISLSGSTPNIIPLDSANVTDEIDAALQKAATAALARREGAIVVMDPRTGRLRALVSSKLAFAQAVMPGSTMKPFTALAALRAGLIDTKSRTVCPGRFTGLSFSLACVHADHLPPFTSAQAIAYSCNYYFGTLGERLGRDKFIETLRPFGFAQTSGVTEKEDTGTLRPCETGNSARIRVGDRDRTTQQSDCQAREAIGESDHIQVTPIQLLTAYAALVNGGHLLAPRLANAKDFHPVERTSISIAPEHRAIITEGLRGAVRYGTAKRAGLDSLPFYILGKTGTSLPAKGFRTNGWFIGFAGPLRGSASNSSGPDKQPDPAEINLAVLVFLSHSHGAEAAAISKSIFETYADALKERDTETRRHPDAVDRVDRSNDELPASPRPRVPASSDPVRLHLVHDNITLDLSLEDYVLGVLGAEGSMETEPEALKALAIAIRTYALKNRGRHLKDGYDFCSTTHCQRFLAERVRSPRVSQGSDDDQALPDSRASDTMIQAARATEGQVLTDDRGQPIDAYFSASCGGETANIRSLWGTNPPAYLRGVRDEFCVAGPHANWTDVITRADLLRALHSDARTDVGSRLDNIVVSKRDETGRAQFIALEGEHRKTVRGWDFKIIVGRVLGWNLLKSSRFEISRAGPNFVFRGSGFGHGLGLCQEGAHVMAQRGANYARILSKYFPGTQIRKDTETRGRGDAAKDFPVESAPETWKPDMLIQSLRSHQSSGRSFDTIPSPRRPGSASPPLRVSASPRPRVSILSSEHFRVTYPANVDRRDADLVLNTLERARADFLHRASASILAELPALEIRINESTGDFVGRTGQPWWAAAATRGNKIELQPAGVLKRRGVLTTTLRHELAHAVIDAVSHNRAPRWLEEGFAIYLAGEGAMISRYSRRSTLSTEELERRLERPGSQEEMRALYAASYRAVSGLIQSEGEAGVWKRLAGS
jgi:SpoIID/LytB domain protein